MRRIVVAVVLAACQSPEPLPPPVETPPSRPPAADAQIIDAPSVPPADWWTTALATLPDPRVTGTPATRYQLAVDAAHAGDRDRAIGILHGLAIEAHCDDCADLLDRSLGEPAFQPYWSTALYRAVYTSQRDRPYDPPDPDAAPRRWQCPPGTHVTGKLDDNGEGEEYCVKPNKQRHGPFHELHSGCSLGEGRCGKSGTYVDGKLDGIYRDWGTYQKSITRVYRAGVPIGMEYGVNKASTEWSFTDATGHVDTVEMADDGHVIKHERTLGGKRDGVYEVNAMDTADPVERGAYIAGYKDGPWVTYADHGVKMSEGTWKRGVPDGVFTYWFNGVQLATTTLANGSGHWIAYDGATKIEEGYYLDGMRDGAWTQGEMRGAYAADRRVGTWTIVDDTGAKIGEGPYVAGKRSGTWRYWSGDALVARSHFANDALDGTAVILDGDGSVTQTLEFRAGTLVRVDGKPATRGDRFAAGDFANHPKHLEDDGAPPE